jgi:hypothetical protein
MQGTGRSTSRLRLLDRTGQRLSYDFQKRWNYCAITALARATTRAAI